MLKVSRRNRQSGGDTLIEVLFAVSVFSLVVVSSLAIMNQATTASIRSLQITLVRQEIDSQADTLRFLNSAYVAAFQPGFTPVDPSPARQYQLISARATQNRIDNVQVTPFGGTTCQTPPATSFILNTRNARYHLLNTAASTGEADTFAKVEYDASGVRAKGIWIEAVQTNSPSGKTVYTDFHIRACWYTTGAGQPMNLGTIVRLYEPTN